MIFKLTKRFLLLVLVVTFVFSSKITIATADNFFSSLRVIPSANHLENIQKQTFFDDDLTPRERQEIQAVRQQRNKEIARILSLSQRQELKHQLHFGYNLHQSLSVINLNSEQKALIKAIEELANLKIKSIITRHAILQSKK